MAVCYIFHTFDVLWIERDGKCSFVIIIFNLKKIQIGLVDVDENWYALNWIMNERYCTIQNEMKVVCVSLSFWLNKVNKSWNCLCKKWIDQMCEKAH